MSIFLHLGGFGIRTFKTWEHTQSIPSRVIWIEKDNKYVGIECLIDKEKGIYEEREFATSTFKGFDLKIGKKFMLYFYEKPGKIKMVIKNGEKLVSEDDFPKIDFSKHKNNSLFKKQKI